MAKGKELETNHASEYMIRKDYIDDDGLHCRVLVPSDDVPVNEGVPLHLDLVQIYNHMPMEFVVRLSNALYARGLIEPQDFMKPGAAELTRNALIDVTKHDALSIIGFAKQQLISK